MAVDYAQEFPFPLFWSIQTRDSLTVAVGFVVGLVLGHPSVRSSEQVADPMDPE
jgi:hypothetical protein